MLPARIKKRPIRFTLWLLTLLSLSVTVASFHWLMVCSRGSNSIFFFQGVISAAHNASPPGTQSQGGAYQVLHISQLPYTSPPLRKTLSTLFRLPRYTPRKLLILPLGWPLLLLTTFTTFAFWRPLKKPTPGLCPQCTYNLTGNTSGKCSECGRPLLDLEQYKKMKEAGMSIDDVARKLYQDSVSPLIAMRILGITYSVKLGAAKEAYVKAEGYKDLDSYQETLIEPLKEVLDELDENKTKA